MNLYNDINPYCCEWLRNLIGSALLPIGDVLEKSIKEVQANEIAHYTQVHLFAGIGGWPYALQLAGWPADRPVWTGSCPCQPFSRAGKRAGIADDRHLWPTIFKLIAEREPPTIFGEQVVDLAWLDLVFSDMERIGYTCRAKIDCAASHGAPHNRQRLFWLADNGSFGRRQRRGQGDRPAGIRSVSTSHTVDGGMEGDPGLANANSKQPPQRESDGCHNVQELTSTERASAWSELQELQLLDGTTRHTQPGIFPLAYGLPRGMGQGSTAPERMELRAAKANRRGRIEGYGNAIVPQVAATFVRDFLAMESQQ